MTAIRLDATSWRSIDDVFDALLPALKAPDWHGRNMDALIDSMGTGDVNGVEPPYVVSVLELAAAPAEVREYVADLARSVTERAQGDGRQVSFDLTP